MKNKENKKTKILAILCILLSIGFISTAFAYSQQATKQVQNTFVVSTGGEMFVIEEGKTIDDYFNLLESEAIQQANGTYTLGSNKVTANTYKLIAGVDVPKDPKISINNKTNIPAYLYLEVAGDTNTYFELDLETCWDPLTGVVGQHGGNVYVYTENNSTTLGEITSKTIGIIAGDILDVKDTFSNSGDKTLSFYAYLAQTDLGNEKDTYTKCFPKPTLN